MSWYYADGGRATGPVSTDEFDRLILEGRITPATKVWQQGMADWQSLESLNRPAPEKSLPLQDATTPALESPAPPVAPKLVPALTCMQCGRSGFADTIISQRNITVCRDCLAALNGALPSNFQTGAVNLSEANTSPLIRRVTAFLIDGVLFFILITALAQVMIGYEKLVEFDLANRRGEAQSYFDKNPLFVAAFDKIRMIVLAFMFFYHAMLTYGIGGSLGKRIVKLRVLSYDNSRISFQQSSVRAAVPVLLLLLMVAAPVLGLFCVTLYLFGYLSAFYDPMRRTWYDRLAKTRVVKDI